MTNAQAQVVKWLYENLLDYDKEPLKYPATYQMHSTRGQFGWKYEEEEKPENQFRKTL